MKPPTTPQQKLDDLARRIAQNKKRLRQKEESPSEKADARKRQTQRVIFIFSEFLAGFGVGYAIGWALDRWLDTSPWFALVFMMLGAASSVVQIFRRAKKGF